MKTANANKLKIKDIITVVLLALINVAIFFASSFLYATPITIVLMPVIFALPEGVVYFIIGTKVKKPGAILIYSVVRAIMGGYLPYILLFILSGIIAELLLWKIGYGRIQNTISKKEKCSDRKLLFLSRRSIPRVSAEAESVSAIRITRSAKGIVNISM